MTEIIDPKVGNPLYKEAKSAIKMISYAFSSSEKQIFVKKLCQISKSDSDTPGVSPELSS